MITFLLVGSMRAKRCPPCPALKYRAHKPKYLSGTELGGRQIGISTSPVLSALQLPAVATTARLFFLTSHFSLLTSHFSLLTSHFSLLTSHFSLLTSRPKILQLQPQLV